MLAGGRHLSFLRIATIAIGGLLLLWLSVAISIAGVMRNRQPEIALRFWPGDGQAMAMQSEALLLREAAAPRHDEELRLAREALAAEPTSARAARIIALFSDEQADVRRRFLYARQLSRRDLFINLWFIEEAVQRNDVPGALSLYDTTLRTSSQAPTVLFPILSSALTQRSLTGPIAELFVTGGEWVPDFFDHVLAERSHVGDLGFVALHRPESLARLRPQTRARFVAELADARKFATGALVYRVLSGRQPMAAGDATPIAVGELPPFDWSVLDTGNYGAASDGGDGALQVYAQGGSRGTVARRLIRLTPGAYRLRGSGTVSQGDATGEAAWSLSCAQADVDPLATLRIEGQPGSRQTRQTDLRTGGACTWYWLSLVVTSPSESNRFQAAIDRPVIERLSG